MTKSEAAKYIASKLAFNTWTHVEACAKTETLLENTRAVHRLNREACETFDVADAYDATLSILTRSGVTAEKAEAILDLG